MEANPVIDKIIKNLTHKVQKGDTLKTLAVFIIIYFLTEHRHDFSHPGTPDNSAELVTASLWGLKLLTPKRQKIPTSAT